MDNMREALMGAFTFCEEGLCKDYPATAESHIRGLAILAGDAMGRIAELEAEVAKLKALTESLANFNPDWDMLEASQDSVREHMQTCQELRSKIERLRGDGDHWAQRNPGLADQYRAEAIQCRNLLGFASHSEDVSPNDLGQAIIDLTRPPAPAIPDEWELLPQDLRTHMHDFKRAVELASDDDSDGCWGYQLKVIARIEAMLSAAPAQESDHENR